MIAWIRRFFGGEPREATPPTPAVATSMVVEPPKVRAELALLRDVAAGDEVGSAAISAFRALLGTSDERAALAEVERIAARAELPEELVRVAGETWLRRGDVDEALGMLARGTSIASRSLRAEALATRGDLVGACAEIERVLAEDIAAPGARERLERWRSRLGLPPLKTTPSRGDATLFTAGSPAPFRIVADAGRGGTASVYRAEDEALGRTIALKVYHRAAESRDQLEREGRVASFVAGPGVVRVLDASFDGGWLAMEWASRGSLREAIRRRDRALLDERGRWATKLVEALARVHDAGWVHGDVKPGNVLFLDDGEPILTDFGLARRPGEAWTGGTPGYLSPERLAGGKASPADDVFAVGATIAESIAALGDGPAWLRSVAAACSTALAERPRTARDVLALARRSADLADEEPP